MLYKGYFINPKDLKEGELVLCSNHIYNLIEKQLDNTGMRKPRIFIRYNESGISASLSLSSFEYWCRTEPEVSNDELVIDLKLDIDLDWM